MTALLVALILWQSSVCAEDSVLARAAQRADAFDLEGAIARLAASREDGCRAADVPFWYLIGLVAASEAYRYGGSPESLEPVRAAIAELKARPSRASDVAQSVLEAAAAAAQSEREEMALRLDHALRLEKQLRAAGARGAPIVSAHEAAGDLWLRVHRFEDARRAYVNAAGEVGLTSRVHLGLARSAARLEDVNAACAEYRMLLSESKSPQTASPEVAEARTFLQRPACQNPPARPSRP
jgi:hypothetical protein